MNENKFQIPNRYLIAGKDIKVGQKLWSLIDWSDAIVDLITDDEIYAGGRCYKKSGTDMRAYGITLTIIGNQILLYG